MFLGSTLHSAHYCVSDTKLADRWESGGKLQGARQYNRDSFDILILNADAACRMTCYIQLNAPQLD